MFGSNVNVPLGSQWSIRPKTGPKVIHFKNRAANSAPKVIHVNHGPQVVHKTVLQKAIPGKQRKIYLINKKPTTQTSIDYIKNAISGTAKVVSDVSSFVKSTANIAKNVDQALQKSMND